MYIMNRWTENVSRKKETQKKMEILEIKIQYPKLNKKNSPDEGDL